MNTIFKFLVKLLEPFEDINIHESNNIGVWNDLPKELFVIGDIHGDYFALKHALELTKCVKFNKNNNMYSWIDEKLNVTDGCKNIYNIEWNPEKKNCFIVFSGDLVDRCRTSSEYCINVVQDEDCDYEILNLLLELDKKAMEYNSRVIIVLGNHELMNLSNKLSYISIKARENKNRLENIKKLIVDNKDRLYGIIRINKYIIVHGGLNKDYFIGKYPNKNNEEIISLFNKEVRENILNWNGNDDDPFWDRTLGLLNKGELKKCPEIFNDNILRVPNDIVNDLQIIVAHCPQIVNPSGINSSSCIKESMDKHKIWKIDIGMSKAFDKYDMDKLTYNLNILKNSLTRQTNLPNPSSFFENSNQEYRKISILKIYDGEFVISDNLTSLQYYFKTVFDSNYYLYYYYLLQDLEKMNLSAENKEIILSIKTIIYNNYIKTQ